jgi:hypothetical protein
MQWRQKDDLRDLKQQQKVKAKMEVEIHKLREDLHFISENAEIFDNIECKYETSNL